MFHGEGEADDLWTLTAQKVHVLLINGDRFLDFPRPLPQNIVFMGELALANPKSKRGKEGREAEKDEGLCEGREAEKENGLGQGQELELEPDLVAVYSREGSKGSNGAMPCSDPGADPPPFRSDCLLNGDP